MTPDNAPAYPPVVSAEDWRRARLALLDTEKALTRQADAVNAQRRRLPMVRVDKVYRFFGESGEATLLDLFENKRQLIVYHFMFDPAWDKGCSGCTSLIDAMGDLSMLGRRHTRFVLISRAPYAKLAAYRSERGWDVPWYSSHGGDFNYDFHVTLDEAVAPIEYNYRGKAELQKQTGAAWTGGEAQGLSVFFRVDDQVHHTYSTYARGVESLTDAYALLDRTPWGRQEAFEGSPPGWPQWPTYGAP